MFLLQIDLYNSVVNKEGTDAEEETKKAYRAAREDSDDTTETTVNDKVSAALINRVRLLKTVMVSVRLVQPSMNLYWLLKGMSILLCCILTLLNVSLLKVDAMLHKLEKEIDDVDAKIGDRWRLLDRYAILHYLSFLDADAIVLFSCDSCVL